MNYKTTSIYPLIQFCIPLCQSEEGMYEFIAKTFHGLESVLEQELNKLGAEEVQKMNRAVSFKGDLSHLYLSLIHI